MRRAGAGWSGVVRLGPAGLSALGEEGLWVGARGPAHPLSFLAPRLSARLVAAPWPPALVPQTRRSPGPVPTPPETRALETRRPGLLGSEEELGDRSGGLPVGPPA